MKKQPRLIVTVKVIPHPNPKRALELAANLFLKNFSDELEQAQSLANKEKRDTNVLHG